MNNLEALQNINNIISENNKLQADNERLKNELSQSQQTIRTQDSQLKKLKPFEGIIDNAPETWTFEISDKMLITAIIKCAISLRGRWANITTAQTPEQSQKASQRINEIVEASLRDVFFNRVRFSEMASRQKLRYSDREDTDGN